MSVFKGFRDFIMRGNVVELAIGVVIGVAFNTLVKSLTDDLITPLINLFGGGGQLGGIWRVHGQKFLWGDVVSALINFILVAAVLYFLVIVPLNKFNEGRVRFFKRGAVRDPEPVVLPPDIELLTQIRDALLANHQLLEATSTGAAAPAQRSGGSHSTSTDGTSTAGPSSEG